MKLFKFITTGTFLFLLISAAATAQTNNDNKAYKFGVKAGYSHASLTENSKKNVWNNDRDARSGFYAGIFGEYCLTPEKGISILVEALYSQQGDSYKYNVSPTNTITTELKLDYINVPVLAKIYVTNWLAFYGGPTVGFKVSEKYDVSSSESGYTVTTDLDDVQSIDVALTGGLSVDIGKRLFVEGRYNHGVKPIVRGTGNNNNNSYIQAGIGFKF